MGIMSKTLLYTTYPPDNKGMSFLRWTYNPEVGKFAAIQESTQNSHTGSQQ